MSRFCSTDFVQHHRSFAHANSRLLYDAEFALVWQAAEAGSARAASSMRAIRASARVGACRHAAASQRYSAPGAQYLPQACPDSARLSMVLSLHAYIRACMHGCCVKLVCVLAPLLTATASMHQLNLFCSSCTTQTSQIREIHDYFPQCAALMSMSEVPVMSLLAR